MRLCAVLIVLAVVQACSSRPPRNPVADLPAPKDTPFELADDSDLQVQHWRFDAQVLFDGTVDKPLREKLAAEYARRVKTHLDASEHGKAYEAFTSLVSLWAFSSTKEHPPKRYLVTAQKIRDAFAPTGASANVAVALAFLKTPSASKDQQQEFQNELKELIQYEKELATVQFGSAALGAGQIEVLEAIISHYPTTEFARELIKHYVTRQREVISLLRRQPDLRFSILRAHGRGTLTATRQVFAAGIRAGIEQEAIKIAALETQSLERTKDIHPLLHRFHTQRNLTSEEWATLANRLAGEPASSETSISGDPVAGLLLLRNHRPTNPPVVFAKVGASLAARIDNPFLRKRYLQWAYKLEPTDETRLELVQTNQQLMLSALDGHRISAARKLLGEVEEIAKEIPGLTEEKARTYHLFGRGLAGAGELTSSQEFLRRATTLAPGKDVYQTQAEIALAQDTPGEAISLATQGIALEANTIADQFANGKLHSIAGKALLQQEKQEQANAQFRLALQSWAELRQYLSRVSSETGGEIAIEMGKVSWHLGEQQSAIRLFEKAVDLDMDGGNTYTAIVSFLLPRNEYAPALDAFHRAMASSGMSDEMKVYMSLWIVGYNRVRAEPEDPVALRFLESRTSQLWYDRLAQMAVGKTPAAALRPHAHSRARRSELAYYTALLTEARNDPSLYNELLREVIATDTVFFFEYQFAKLKLNAVQAP